MAKLALLLSVSCCAALQLVASDPSTLYPDCPDVPHDWLPECWISVYARISIGGDRMFYWTPYTTSRWGNSLSPYWQARALAQLAGHGFDAYDGFDRFWLKYLPKQLPPASCPNLELFQKACNMCDSESWQYAHRCSGAWQFIRPAIINDTQAAVHHWAADRNRSLPSFTDGDTVIQSRCSAATLLQHAEYGPVGFSFYSHIPAGTRNIWIVHNPQVKLAVCAELHRALVKFLQERHPDAQVAVVGGSLEHDFFYLMLAPVLFRDASSSFGLWAGLANAGQVYSVPLLKAFNHNRSTTPDLGPSWHWVDAPVLYPQVARAHGIARNAPAIIQWLETH